MIVLKSPHEIGLMRQAGRIVAEVLEMLSGMAKPGVTTGELDRAAAERIHKRGGRPTFKGYRGYPANICTCVNHELVHGIPSSRRRLNESDILSLDLGVTYQGFVGDAGVTVPIGAIDAVAQRLLDATEGSLYAGIEQATPGRRIGDISAAVQQYVESRGFTVIREYTGHGVGRAMHEEPQVPNFGKPKRGPRLVAGMTLAIEPMLNAGGPEIRTLDDQWTVVTADGSLSAHFEHTVLIDAEGPRLLTAVPVATEA
jgi:methionyl aminopeptidase